MGGLYGDMFDQLTDMWKTTKVFALDLDGSLSTSDDPQKKSVFIKKLVEGDNGVDEGTRERQQIAISIKVVQKLLSRLNWEGFRTDFAKWIKQIGDGDVMVREQLESLLREANDILGLLTLSRVVVDERLAEHVYIAASNLADFFEQMRNSIEQSGVSGSRGL